MKLALSRAKELLATTTGDPHLIVHATTSGAAWRNAMDRNEPAGRAIRLSGGSPKPGDGPFGTT